MISGIAGICYWLYVQKWFRVQTILRRQKAGDSKHLCLTVRQSCGQRLTVMLSLLLTLVLCFSHQTLPGSVTSVFDLFKIDGNGEPVLLEARQSLEAAMARVITLRESLPADYVVVSEITGKKISFTANGGIQRT